MFKYLVSKCSRSQKMYQRHTSYYFQFPSQCSPCAIRDSYSELQHSSFCFTYDRIRAITQVGLLTFCAADGTTDCFLHTHANDIENHLKHVNDKAFAETLQPGVGFYHKVLSKQDKRIVEELFENGRFKLSQRHVIHVGH